MQEVETITGLEVGLGKRLQEARRTAGLTQQQLCQKAGLSYSTLAKIERGAIKSPSIFTIQQIANVLQTSLDALVGQSSGTPALLKRISKSGVSFVYFDVNGCLVRFFHRAFTKLAEDTGASPDVIESTFWHYNDAVCRGEMSMEEFNQAFAAKLDLESLKWQNYYIEAVTPIKEMHELARWAAGQYQIGLLTNLMPGVLNMLKQRQLVPDLPYAAVVDSSEAGAIKPEEKIYEIAEQKAGVTPTEILLVDDSRANLMPASRRGWHVLWFDDYNPSESVKRVQKVLEPAD
jgi:FMN phosphatase YigB (HAD superfamily)/DNA-binding XRE family transcriptional regulator